MTEKRDWNAYEAKMLEQAERHAFIADPCSSLFLALADYAHKRAREEESMAVLDHEHEIDLGLSYTRTVGIIDG